MLFFTDSFNGMYDTEELPQNWLISVFIPTPKKKNAKNFADIIETQFGFRKLMREMFDIQALIQRARDVKIQEQETTVP